MRPTIAISVARSSHAHPAPRSPRRGGRAKRGSALALATIFLLAVACNHYGPADRASSQLAFGVDMAKRGLWSEALFRFREAERGEPQNPRVQNNLGVAYEAQGNFDKALEHYKRALEFAPSDRQVRANYTRFVEFYQGFKSTPDRNALAGQFGKGKTASGGTVQGAPPAPPPPAPPTPPKNGAVPPADPGTHPGSTPAPGQPPSPPSPPPPGGPAS